MNDDLLNNNEPLVKMRPGQNEMILQSVGEGICVIDKHGRVSFANLSAANMLGWNPDELPGRSYKEIFFRIIEGTVEDEIGAAISPIEFALNEGDTFHVNTENFYRATGEMFLTEYICIPLLEDGEITGAVVTFQDITERRDLEIAIAKARDAALESVKVKARFLANMSHEIRTPLNGIIGIASLLSETELSPLQSDYVRILKTSGDLLLEIVNDILDFSKIEARKLVLDVISFDLLELVSDVVKLFSIEASNKGIRLSFQIDDRAAVRMHGDAVRLRQILNNLISNAVKFTEKGEVAVRVAQLADDLWRFDITDTGIGVAPYYQTSIFEAFSQADISTTRRFGGTGLGLAISKQLVQLMGGEIGLESEPGLGSKFWFTAKLFNEAESAVVAADDSPALHDTNDGRKKDLRILLAEDNRFNEIITLEMLKNMGYQADVVNNGADAVEAVREKEYDLILMDCLMPKMDGYEATRIIRNFENPARPVKIIALTASSVEGEREKCIAVGMDDFISKPFAKVDLSRVLADHFGPQDLPQTLDLEDNISHHPLSGLIDPAILKQLLEIEANGQKGFVEEMLAIYLAHSEVNFEKMQKAFDERDKTEIAHLAHALRGSTGNMGLLGLYNALLDFENEVEVENWTAAEQSVRALLKEFAGLKEKSSRLIDAGD